jgi:hypothetical protein
MSEKPNENILSNENAEFLLELIQKSIETGQNNIVLGDDKDEH